MKIVYERKKRGKLKIKKWRETVWERDRTNEEKTDVSKRGEKGDKEVKNIRKWINIYDEKWKVIDKEHFNLEREKERKK